MNINALSDDSESTKCLTLWDLSTLNFVEDVGGWYDFFLDNQNLNKNVCMYTSQNMRSINYASSSVGGESRVLVDWTLSECQTQKG